MTTPFFFNCRELNNHFPGNGSRQLVLSNGSLRGYRCLKVQSHHIPSLEKILPKRLAESRLIPCSQLPGKYLGFCLEHLAFPGELIKKYESVLAAVADLAIQDPLLELNLGTPELMGVS